jgi:conjugative transfer signal peptidase TraF
MKLIPTFAALCLIFSVGLWFAIESGFKIILSPSVPMGIWHVSKLTQPLRRGDFVWFCPPDTAVFRQARERGYLQPGDCPGNYLHLMKPVAAILGDNVRILKDGVRVNGKFSSNSVPLIHDSNGRVLKSNSGQFTVRAGTVWLLSSFDKHSYDSRYFGAIELWQIAGFGRPVWVLKQIEEL